MSSDPQEQFRELRAKSFTETFDRVVWLDAAAISAIVAAWQTGSVALRSKCLIGVSLVLLSFSLLITLCVPMWRAITNAAHEDARQYRRAWEIYIAQFIAAAMTGVGIMLALLSLLQ